jgi:hypothetical protein
MQFFIHIFMVSFSVKHINADIFKDMQFGYPISKLDKSMKIAKL